eukprot:COSAG02_NODE_72783_length_181_cov_25.890244_1_plen_60_part_11
MTVFAILNTQMIAGAESRPRATTAPRTRRRAGRAERRKNANSAHADAGSIGPSALDREDR